MSEIYEVATFYAHFNIVKNKKSFDPIKVVRVCESLTCELFGAQKILEDLKIHKKIKILKLFQVLVWEDVMLHLQFVLVKIMLIMQLQKVIETINKKDFDAKIPNYKTYEDYINEGGYLFTKKIDNKIISNEEIIKCLNDSGLKGKGGAGFPTGRKWELVLQNEGEKFIAINGDEGEPGTFKDKLYLETDPHRFLEGVLLLQK